MLVVVITLKDKEIREDNVTRYGVENNVLFLEKTLFRARGKKSKWVNKYYPLYNIISYEVYNYE